MDADSDTVVGVVMCVGVICSSLSMSSTSSCRPLTMSSTSSCTSAVIDLTRLCKSLIAQEIAAKSDPPHPPEEERGFFNLASRVAAKVSVFRMALITLSEFDGSFCQP